MLASAGVACEAIASAVDEPALRQRLEASGAATTPAAVALALAEAKALDVARHHPDALVIGADQVLALGDRIFEKPPDIEAARRHLLALRGQSHVLISAVVLVRGETIEWTCVDTATLAVRAFGPAFLDGYLGAAGPVVCQSVGAYQLEGLGAQLFDRIEGDYFTILGMPLIPLLAELRTREVLPA
jgi:septum formation protein